MKSLRRQPQYLDIFPFNHRDDPLSESIPSTRFLWRVIVGLTVTVGMLVGLALIGAAK